MKITEILTADMVVPDVGGTTKSQVLRELAGPLANKYRDLDLAAITAVLGERERLGSTAIGDGIAIPHGKLPGVRQITGAFGRHRWTAGGFSERSGCYRQRPYHVAAFDGCLPQCRA